MKIRIPDKSIFGFKVLNSWQSILTAYTFIIVQNLLTPLFGNSNKEIFSASLFIITSNISILILIFNSIIRIKKRTYIWLIFYFPLIIYIPFVIKSTTITVLSILR